MIEIPRKTKYRKPHKVKYDGKVKGCRDLAYFNFGLKTTSANNVTSAQIKAAREAIKRHIKGVGKVIFRIFPHFSKTKKPIEVRMGSGKGSPEFFYFPVRKDTVIIEVGNVNEKTAREALKLGSIRLPLKTKFIMKNELKLENENK
jgi:large subunit ribosomal protein L16